MKINDMFGNIVDSCIRFDQTRLFHNPVRKKDVPNYYDVIKTPIDLNTMKSKVKRSGKFARRPAAIYRGRLVVWALSLQNTRLSKRFWQTSSC